MGDSCQNRDFVNDEPSFENEWCHSEYDESTVESSNYDEYALGYEEYFWCSGSKSKAAKKSGQHAVRLKKNKQYLRKDNIDAILKNQQAKDKERKKRARERNKKSNLSIDHRRDRKEQKFCLLKIERSARKLEKRAKESDAQIVARKERIRSRVERQGTWRYSLELRWFGKEGDYDPFQYYDASDYVNQEDILPARDLGIDDKAMYRRLLAIVNGADIQPEDFDLLLQLDTNNTKSTMDVNEVSKFSLSIVGEKKEHEGKQCQICLETFQEMEEGKSLRILPCKHVFCTECIDHWLMNNSVRCPELSCFWSEEKEESSAST
mmetsp:Transcript_17716/g.24926  ORF Transcript_17716/g.24926 Transcript_17716/m.24926 type:complete len:321 (-) Transcript_17716:96-1058(-)